MVRRRRPLSPAFAEVLAELRAPWRVDVALIEGLAEQAHERGGLGHPFVPGELLALRLGYLVLNRAGDGCGGGALLANVLFVQPSAEAHRHTLRTLHELAHRLLDQHARDHGHADVWALTLALAVPRSAYRQADHADHVARWVLALRRRTARAVARST